MTFRVLAHVSVEPSSIAELFEDMLQVQAPWFQGFDLDEATLLDEYTFQHPVEIVANGGVKITNETIGGALQRLANCYPSKFERFFLQGSDSQIARMFLQFLLFGGIRDE